MTKQRVKVIEVYKGYVEVRRTAEVVVELGEGETITDDALCSAVVEYVGEDGYPDWHKIDLDEMNDCPDCEIERHPTDAKAHLVLQDEDCVPADGMPDPWWKASKEKVS